MNDMFEIGVTLALGDGVGESISRARRDMAALKVAASDHAITVTQLQRLAAGRRPVAEAPRPAAVPTPPKQIPDSEAKAATPTSHSQETRSLATLPVPSRAERAVRSSPAPRAPTRVTIPMMLPTQTPSQATPAAPVAAAQTNHSGLLQAAPAIPASRAAVEAPKVTFPKASSSKAPVLTMKEQRALPPPPVGAASGRAISQAAVRATPSRSESAAPPASRAASSSPVGTSVAPPPRPSTGNQALRRSEGAAPTTARAADAPVAALPQRLPAVRTEANSNEKTESRSGPAEGDVYLDGALVGRWLSRYLAREAGLPSSGPTGFDPRRTPQRPGATAGVL